MNKLKIFRDVKYCLHATSPYPRWVGIVHIILPKEELKKLEETSGKGLLQFTLTTSEMFLYHEKGNLMIRLFVKRNLDIWKQVHNINFYFYGCDEKKVIELQKEIADKSQTGDFNEEIMKDVILAKKEIRLR